MSLDAIRAFILNDILDDPERPLEPDEDLLLGGTLDSLSVIRLVGHLEGETGIVIPPEDVTLENFATLAKIEAYLVTRQA